MTYILIGFVCLIVGFALGLGASLLYSIKESNKEILESSEKLIELEKESAELYEKLIVLEEELLDIEKERSIINGE